MAVSNGVNMMQHSVSTTLQKALGNGGKMMQHNVSTTLSSPYRANSLECSASAEKQEKQVRQ
jgi:hypothetical protein